MAEIMSQQMENLDRPLVSYIRECSLVADRVDAKKLLEAIKGALEQ
jgi:hypothetical protein